MDNGSAQPVSSKSTYWKLALVAGSGIGTVYISRQLIGCSWPKTAVVATGVILGTMVLSVADCRTPRDHLRRSPILPNELVTAWDRLPDHLRQGIQVEMAEGGEKPFNSLPPEEPIFTLRHWHYAFTSWTKKTLEWLRTQSQGQQVFVDRFLIHEMIWLKSDHFVELINRFAPGLKENSSWQVNGLLQIITYKSLSIHLYHTPEQLTLSWTTDGAIFFEHIDVADMLEDGDLLQQALENFVADIEQFEGNSEVLKQSLGAGGVLSAAWRGQRRRHTSGVKIEWHIDPEISLDQLSPETLALTFTLQNNAVMGWSVQELCDLLEKGQDTLADQILLDLCLLHNDPVPLFVFGQGWQLAAAEEGWELTGDGVAVMIKASGEGFHIEGQVSEVPTGVVREVAFSDMHAQGARPLMEAAEQIAQEQQASAFVVLLKCPLVATAPEATKSRLARMHRGSTATWLVDPDSLTGNSAIGLSTLVIDFKTKGGNLWQWTMQELLEVLRNASS
jgi:hypothetical protein